MSEKWREYYKDAYEEIIKGLSAYGVLSDSDIARAIKDAGIVADRKYKENEV